MKILVGSDYHCDPQLQAEAIALLPEVDWYINCGDFCTQAGRLPEAKRLGVHPRGEGELDQLQQFWQRLDAIGKPWLFVPGNHEPPAPTLAGLYEKSGCQNGRLSLATELMQLGPLQVLVVPWTPPCGWCWSLSREHVEEVTQIYSDTDVDMLVTHAPPKGVLDEGGQWYRAQTPTLLPVVRALSPRYYLCGHMHADGGQTETKNGTTFVNAAKHNLAIELDLGLG
ncbi:metallophosphoesterase [Synechococcus sp. PCC 7336]|uniref:metallophosphoesterase family protein n=1 Tax=Synechococcus sp. PCC 7336 TaxID=195250 RepID=UPI0003480E4D|nr:metallophosphoesterase [Synechococcus sp. PCC 7336]